MHSLYQTSGLKKPMNFSASSKTSRGNSSRPVQPVKNDPPPIVNNYTEIDVLCINCMKMIKVSLAPEHSLHCSQVNSEVKLIDQCSLIQQADYKIRRLKDSISSLSRNPDIMHKESTNGYYVQMLLAYCEDILKVVDFTKADVLKCREIIFNLIALIKGFKGLPKIMVYMERFLVVSREKYSQLINYYKEIAANDLGGESDVNKPKEELKRLAAEKAEQLRKSLNNVSGARASINSERKTNAFSPTQVTNANARPDEVTSEIGGNEYF